MKTIPFTITQDSVVVVWEGKPYTIQKGAPNFLAIRTAILDEKWDDVPKHLSTAKSLKEWAKGKFTLEGDTFSYDGREIPRDINARILSMATNGEDPQILFNFWERLSRNPSFRSVNQLYGFLKHAHIPMTPDGCFLAYKGVRRDYKDVHSGSFDNSPGAVNKMPRNQISDDPNMACHEGFHVGALEYAQSFHSGGRVVVCKVDPEHVVCVPHDASSQKMRVCEYKVLGNHGSDLPSTSFQEEEGVEEEEEDNEIETEDEDGDDEGSSDSGNEEDGEDSEEREDSEGEETVSAAPSAEVGKEEKKDEKPRKKHKYDGMDFKALMEQPIGDLRKYAAGPLQIVGASKIPGGKLALVKRIIDVRA